MEVLFVVDDPNLTEYYIVLENVDNKEKSNE
jgi:hypothetical protein